MRNQKSIDILQSRITDEIYRAAGLSKAGLLRRLTGWMFYLPTRRFCRIFSRADDAVANGGLRAGCKCVIDDFHLRVQARGIETIPTEGPLLIVSNHPGAYDSVCLAACQPRQDLKILVGDNPFFRSLMNSRRWFIYATRETVVRMLAIRNAVEQLRQGGSLLLFGAGKIEPDPAYQPHAEQWLERWSSSLEVLLHKVPQTQLVQAVVSGILLPKFARNPLIYLRQDEVDRRRIAEFVQVIQHMLIPSSVQVNIRLTFAPPVSVEQLRDESEGRRLMPAILNRQRKLLKEHITEAVPS